MHGAARAVDAASITRQGNGRGAAPCMACHGVDGGGQAEAGNPRLAGLDATYLHKQLDDFASGTRSNPVMHGTASALNDEERAALADYYSKLPAPRTLRSPAEKMPPADAPGATLAVRGRWDKGLPACVQCHGPRGVGVGAGFPPLAGQPPAYIESQLKAWQAGTRRNDPLQLMQHVASALDAQDIHAVAAWFAAQSMAPAAATP